MDNILNNFKFIKKILHTLPIRILRMLLNLHSMTTLLSQNIKITVKFYN